MTASRREWTFAQLWREQIIDGKTRRWVDCAEPIVLSEKDGATEHAARRAHQIAMEGHWIRAGRHDGAVTDLHEEDIHVTEGRGVSRTTSRVILRGGHVGGLEPLPDGMTGREWHAAQMRRFLDNSSLT